MSTGAVCVLGPFIRLVAYGQWDLRKMAGPNAFLKTILSCWPALPSFVWEAVGCVLPLHSTIRSQMIDATHLASGGKCMLRRAKCKPPSTI
eukprot:scaffold211442_cov33-Tisochrysis_lutea.AAC.1